MLDFKPNNNTPDNYIKNDYIELWINDGILFGKYFEGVFIDQQVAERVLEDREKISKGKPYPTVWDCRGVKYWTKEAREFQNTLRNYSLMKAGAVIYTESHVASILINFFLKINRPPIPSKFFTSPGKAVQWVQQFK